MDAKRYDAALMKIIEARKELDELGVYYFFAWCPPGQWEDRDATWDSNKGVAVAMKAMFDDDEAKRMLLTMPKDWQEAQTKK